MNIVHPLLSGGDPDFEDIYVEVPWIEILTRHDFPTFYREVIDPMGLSAALFGFLQAWWPLRNQPNVLLLHFADMKRDHEGSLRQIADFTGARPTNQEWSAITEYTSFSWMNQHRIKFDTTTAAAVPVLRPGAMVRTGKTGATAEDGMTPEIAQHLRAVGSQICQDDRVLQWLYEGGPQPG